MKITTLKNKKLAAIPLLYMSLCLTLYVGQRSLLYSPDKSNDYNDRLWETLKLNDQVLGLETKDDYEQVIILFHGRSQNAAGKSAYQKFFPQNYHLIVVEYPGYGLNNTQSISKKNFLKHARDVMQYAKDKYGDNIILTGESLGTGVASQMASEFDIKKLFLITPYSSVKDVAQRKYWYAPIFLLLKDNYDNVKNLKNYSGETLILISEKDTVIPPRYAEKLYNSLKTNKDKIVVEQAHHTNWGTYLNTEQLDKIRNFITT